MKSKRNILYGVLAVLAVAATVFLMATYGTALLSSPFAEVQLKGPTSVDSDGEFTAIADTESRRVLILNSDNNLTGVVDCTTFDSPMEAVTDVCVSGGEVYVLGVKYKPDSPVIEKERIAIYDKGGNLLSVLFELEGSDSELPTVKGMSPAEGGVVISVDRLLDNHDDDVASSQRSSLAFDFVGDDGRRELASVSERDWAVYRADYAAGAGKYIAVSIRGMITTNVDGASQSYAGRVFTDVAVAEDETLYAVDDVSGSICAIAGGEVREIVADKGFDGVQENNGVLSACASEANMVLLSGSDGTVRAELSSIVPSVGYSARMVFVWASALYLAALVLVLAVRALRRRIRAGQMGTLGPMLASVAVIATIAMAVGTFAQSSHDASVKTRLNEISLSADYLESIAGDLSASMASCSDRDAFRKGDDELNRAFMNVVDAAGPASSLVDAANKNGIGLYYVLYGEDDQGVFCLIDSSVEHVLGSSARKADEGGVLAAAFDAGSDFDSQKMHEGQSLRDATFYRLVRIPSQDGEGVAGVIEIGSRVRAFESSLTIYSVQTLFTLLVMVLVVYLAYIELRACARCLFSYRKLQERRSGDAVAALTRPFTFAITMLSGIDAVMTILIARDLVAATGAGTSSPLMAVPAAMFGVGLILGQALYGRLGARVGLRRLMAGGAALMMLCAGLTFASVVSGIFWLYCAAKLCLSVPFGMLYTLGYSLPRIAETDEARTAAAGGVRRTDVSAAALGTVIGGYAAQSLGNAWVYALVALACLPLIMMALNLLPKGMRPLEESASSRPSQGGVFAFLRSVPAISIALFVVFPSVVAAGYASFLFPLFSVDLGLEKSDINNIVALGQLVVFVCISRIEYVESRIGAWRMTTAAVFLLGVVFLLFSLNATIVWSVAVVALVALFGKSADGWKALWLRSAGDAGVAAGPATSAMFAVRSVAQVVQPFIMGALLAATDSVAVLVIGAFCVVCAASFYALTRRTLSRLAPASKNSPPPTVSS